MARNTISIQTQQNLDDIKPTLNKMNLDGAVISAVSGSEQPESNSGSPRRPLQSIRFFFRRLAQILTKFWHFIGPGFFITVAYIDPGNYSTDVSAGAEYRYTLLFMVFLSNIIAVFLQVLCIKLGTVTGLNLAEMCRKHLPKWVVIILYLLSEAAIIATDISEVGMF